VSDVEKPRDKLRTGFTTGASAAAAAKSALLAMINQK
jgi:cobalt-precorrin-5B (C1)-methyltransferase